MDDWRLTGQEKYMKKAHLKKVSPNNYALEKEQASNWHEHCEFCMKTIDINTKNDCFATLDEYRWVCQECFDDFKDSFEWELE